MKSIISKFKLRRGNIDLLNRQIAKGFNPKWYCVIRFNDGGKSNKQQKRRLQSWDVLQDTKWVKHQLYSEIYNKDWIRKEKRVRSMWSVEYGTSQVPQINLIIEQLPFPYDDFKGAFILMDRFLPVHCKCLFKWKKTTYLQPINENDGIYSYINKECRIQSESHTYDFRNADLLHEINDYI